MLKRKNIVSLALSFMLILTSLLFVGCGKKPEKSRNLLRPKGKGLVLFRF